MGQFSRRKGSSSMGDRYSGTKNLINIIQLLGVLILLMVSDFLKSAGKYCTTRVS